MESLVVWFSNTLGQYISAKAVVFIISMLPILELRGGFLAASLLKIPMLEAIPICIIGNILPIPFLLLFLKHVLKLLKKVSFLRGFVTRLESRALRKSDSIRRYEFWGLVLFVGIPIPGTGAWTGSLIATLLDVDVKKSSLAVLLGIVMATVIMLFVSYGVVGNLVS